MTTNILGSDLSHFLSTIKGCTYQQRVLCFLFDNTAMETLRKLATVQQLIDSGQVKLEQKGLLLTFDADCKELLESVKTNLRESFVNKNKHNYYLSEILKLANGKYRLLATSY